MKTRGWLLIVLALTLSISSFAGYSSTQAASHVRHKRGTQDLAMPVAQMTPAPTDVSRLPGGAADLDNPSVDEALNSRWRTLSEGQTHWYTFQL